MMDGGGGGEADLAGPDGTSVLPIHHAGCDDIDAGEQGLPGQPSGRKCSVHVRLVQGAGETRARRDSRWKVSGEEARTNSGCK